jgi:glutamate N-acetyltransferase/amino-acid N-acetyltransferase
MIINGFKFAAVKSGIRGKDRPDMGLIVCQSPAAAAGVFTTNLVQAAPVILGRERIATGLTQAVLVNSGIANACTGDEGLANANKCAKLAANALEIDEKLVLVSSTGVIGEQFEMNCFTDHMPELAATLGADKLQDVAQAIMTTDTVPKLAERTVQLGDKSVKLAGITKGAGMIMPNMATMLCFIMTDAIIDSVVLQAMLAKSVQQSFNRITVDGDTSTNDTAIIMASGLAENSPVVDADSAEGQIFAQTLNELCRDLAMQIVADGEGATKLVTVAVRGAQNDQEAEIAARAVANSALVKTAFFGEDANWGRIMGALGRSGANFSQEQVSICFDTQQIVAHGQLISVAAEEAATKVLHQKEFSVQIDLGAGKSSCKIYTCDLSLDYIKINADYRT